MTETTTTRPQDTAAFDNIFQAAKAEMSILEIIFRRGTVPGIDPQTCLDLNQKFVATLDRFIEIYLASGAEDIPGVSEPLARLQGIRNQLARMPRPGRLSAWARIWKTAGRFRIALFGPSRSDRPRPPLSKARLRALAAKHRPPQEWFDADMEKPF